MPTENLHKDMADRNKLFQRELCIRKLSQEYREWEIISLFYSAVHTLDLTLHSSGYSDAGKHSVRFEMLKSEAKKVGGYDFNLLTYYQDLYTKSCWARYDCKTFTREEVREVQSIFREFERLAHKEREKLRAK